MIWAAGVQASPLAELLAEASGASIDRAGRIEVLPDLSLPGHPEVFAVGDMASIDNLPGVAEVAMQGGLHAANTILRRLKGKDTKNSATATSGSVATIGRFRAIVSVKGIRLSGFPGWVVWMFVHLAFLTGFGNRLIDHAQVAAVDDRTRPRRTRVQHRPYGRRPEPARRGQGPGRAVLFPMPDIESRIDGPGGGGGRRAEPGEHAGETSPTARMSPPPAQCQPHRPRRRPRTLRPTPRRKEA